MGSLQEDADQLRIQLQFAALYHSRRYAFFSNISKFLKVLIILTGTTALTATVTDQEYKVLLTNYLPIVVAIFATVDLVFSFSDLANEHRFLSKALLQLNSRLEMNANSETEILTIKSEMIGLFTGAPPQMHALSRDCRNLIIRRFGIKDRVTDSDLNWFERCFMHFFSLPRATS